MSLTDFLLARIAEDEVAARAGLGEPAYRHFGDDAVEESIEMALSEGCAEEGADHLRRWLPARVLAECEAKRGAIDAAWDDQVRIEGEWGKCQSREQMSAKGDNPLVVEWLALPYADHPDYDEAWRP